MMKSVTMKPAQTRPYNIGFAKMRQDFSYIFGKLRISGVSSHVKTNLIKNYI